MKVRVNTREDARVSTRTSTRSGRSMQGRKVPKSGKGKGKAKGKRARKKRTQRVPGVQKLTPFSFFFLFLLNLFARCRSRNNITFFSTIYMIEIQAFYAFWVTLYTCILEVSLKMYFLDYRIFEPKWASKMKIFRVFLFVRILEPNSIFTF